MPLSHCLRNVRSAITLKYLYKISIPFNFLDVWPVVVQPVPVLAGGGQADDGEGLPDVGGAGGVSGGGAGGGGQLQGAAGRVAGREPSGPGHRHLHHHQQGVCIYIYRYLHRPEVTSAIILGQHLTILASSILLV